MTARRSTIGPDWSKNPGVDDPHPWRVDGVAAEIGTDDAKAALRLAVVSARRERAMHEEQAWGVMSRPKALHALEKAHKALAAIENAGVMERLRPGGKPLDFCSADELEGLFSYMTETGKIFAAALARVAEVREQIAADRDRKSVSDPATFRAGQRMYFFIREAVIRNAGQTEAMTWRALEAAWLDAGFPKVGEWKSGPEFRKSLRKRLF